MKKRILAALLTLAMVFGMLPAVALAEDNIAPIPSGPVYRAAYAPTVAVDGALETVWLTDGTMSGDDTARAFGVLWKGSNLYFAAIPQAGDDSLNITLGETVITVSKTDGGVAVSGIDGASAAWTDAAVEVSIPWQTITAYGKLTDMTVSMGGASWEGVLVTSSLERIF